MNLHLQPNQFLVLYNCVKKCENEFYDEEEAALIKSIKHSLEGAIVGAFESLESQAAASSFNKWAKFEDKKIKDLDAQLKQIEDSTSNVMLDKLRETNTTKKYSARSKRH